MPSFISRRAPQQSGINERYDMQKCSTAFRLLLIAPALFILLQVKVALHHHHGESYHDDKDSLHSFLTVFSHDNVKQDKTVCLASLACLFPHFGLWAPDSDRTIIIPAALSSNPPQSRAPPLATSIAFPRFT
ncbi:MAG: hypothetical protein WCI45_01425 [Desulfuromonadales bacterium]